MLLKFMFAPALIIFQIREGRAGLRESWTMRNEVNKARDETYHR